MSKPHPQPIINYDYDNSIKDWISEGECFGKNDLTSSFFYGPNDGHEESRNDKEAREAAARSYCNVCTVAKMCLEFALFNRIEDGGIWGGLNDAERKRIIAGNSDQDIA